MSKKVLLTATVQSHICQFHKPLMKSLQENGYEVHVAARNNLAEKNGLEMEFADKVYDIPFDRSPFSLKNLNAYKELSKVLKSNEYEVIHTNTPVGGFVTRLAARKYRKNNGTKVFYTAHGFHFYNGAPLKNWMIYYPIEKVMSRFTDILITITHEDFDLALKNFKCNVEYVHGVGANSSKFFVMSDDEKKALREELGFKTDDVLILNVGELNQNKNQKAIIKTIPLLKDQIPNIKLMLAGNGDNLENLKSLVAELDIDDYVKFIGYTTELEKYTNICDLAVACSYREGLPLNVMEAFLCGKPVVASDNRGHRELIDNGTNGYLVKADDIDAYKSRIFETLKNIDYLSKNALESVIAFTDKSVIKELKKIYNLS